MKSQNNNEALPLLENANFVSLAKLFGLHLEFNIPEYQRGYRWTAKQVQALIDDIEDFYPETESEFYSVQPLVVQRRTGSCTYDVIDGQQRLTTLYILLKALHAFDESTRFSIQYSTRNGNEERSGSHEFLEHIADGMFKCKSDQDWNIDFEQMQNAYKTARDWAEAVPTETRLKFVDKMLNRVKFLWYDIGTADPIEVFTRLNVDKIPLTGAELIKAKFLKIGDGDQSTAQNRAFVWDQMERCLNDDKFWYFLHRDHKNSEERIFWFLELAYDWHAVGDHDPKKIHHEFYNVVSSQILEDSNQAWHKVDDTYWMLLDWFDDIEFYHYVGYLSHCAEDRQMLVADLKKEWLSVHENREKFKDYLHSEIRMTLTSQMDSDGRIDLWKEYEKDGVPKTQCRNLLLLHNVLSTIKANQRQKLEFDVGDVFYKFPFNLFEAEKWNIEHIDSNTANDLKEVKDQREWLRCVLGAGVLPEGDRKQVYEALSHDSITQFGKLIKQLEESIKMAAKKRGVKLLSEGVHNEQAPDTVVNEKNFIWNYALLDENTNKGYGNSVFAAKRRVIIGKTKGVKYTWDPKTMDFVEEHAESAFVPYSTLNVFLKYYSSDANNLIFWGVTDANGYLKSIREVLSEIKGIQFRPNARDQEVSNG